MFKIYKLREDPVVDFAALELKKYLCMMMLDCGDIRISYDPTAQDGFRLGLLEDFSLPFTGEDPFWDDEVYIDTDVHGGILAGANPRSVLFAVYRYLKLNGCKFLAPGVDGEYIPMQMIIPAKYHKIPDNRIRGYTIEGRPSLQNVLAYVDYHAKCELNRFSPASPYIYMRKWYEHSLLQKHRRPEPITHEAADQFLRQIECACAQRGQILTNGAHEVMCYVYGADPKDKLLYETGALEPTEEMRSRMAMIDGKRDLYRKNLSFTNFCMSRPELRQIYVDKQVEYIKKNRHLNMVQCSLADLPRNHCECEECQKLNPTDFHVMMLNAIDERLTAEGIDTKLGFSTYVDQQFAPIQEKLKNHDRFIMSFCPISRSYTSSITADSVYPAVKPYVRNKWESPNSMEELLAYYRHYRKTQNFNGPGSSFEYHFWRHQYLDPGMVAMSRRLHADIRALPLMDMAGMTEDGSNKSFFPNGLQSYVYSRTLTDSAVEFDTLVEEYFPTAYGEDWKLAYDYLCRISQLFDHEYMCGEKGIDPSEGIYYDPARVANFDQVISVAKETETLAGNHRTMPYRIQSVHWQLLEHHTRWCVALARVMKIKCCGHDDEAKAAWTQAIGDFSKYDVELDPYFDMSLAAYSLNQLMNKVKPTVNFF